MTKIWSDFSTKLDKFLAPMDDVLVVVFAAVFALLAQMFGLLP